VTTEGAETVPHDFVPTADSDLTALGGAMSAGGVTQRGGPFSVSLSTALGSTVAVPLNGTDVVDLSFGPPYPRPWPRLKRSMAGATAVGATSARRAGAGEPLWIRALDSTQRSLRQPVPVALDAAAMTTVLVVVGLAGAAPTARLGPPAAIHAPAAAGSVLAGLLAYLAAGMLFGQWKYRSTLEAQGLLWYLKPAALASVSSALAALAAGASPARSTVVAVAGVATLGVVHLVLWLALGQARRRGRALRRALVVGPPSQVSVVEHRLSLYPEAGLRPVASYHPEADEWASPAQGKARVQELIGRHRVEHIICVASHTDAAIFKDFVRFASGRVDFSFVFPLSRLSQAFSHMGDLNVAAVPMRSSWGSEAAKRVFDVVASALALILLAPLLLAVAVAVRIGDPGPVIFRQLRPGRGGRPFTIYKFRSMRHEASVQPEFLSRDETGSFGFKFAGDPRVTPVGAFIRRFSLDEMPQLWNVLKGDMSLVGPRPLAFSPDDFDLRAQIRFRVRPGITGLWQVSGANALADGDLFDLDMSYVVNRTFGLDILLVLKTIPTVLVRRAPS
jgi:exopolysaccharide biosynthesis polyprenyl glycosylphosphotransferase